MDLLKTIRNLLIIVILFGVASAGIDYYRITEGQKPVFCKSSYDGRSHIETYRGLFYVAQRKVKESPSEKLEMSSGIIYKFLNQVLKVNLPYPINAHDYILFVKKSLNCPLPSRLYVQLEDKKVFIDCIDSIGYKEKNKKEYTSLDEVLSKNAKLLDAIINDLSLTGVGSDGTTEKYEALNNAFVNQHIYVYRCNNSVKDVYITMNPRQETDYCTIK